MTVIPHVTEIHLEEKDREIEAKEEIIRLQADEIVDLKRQLGDRVHGGRRA